MLVALGRGARLVALASLSMLSILGSSCARKTEGSESLLAGRVPASHSGIRNVDRLTDGVASHEGDFWDSDVTARFSSRDGTATYDLGSVRPIRCALIQVDNNDIYQLAGSVDGSAWTHLWDAHPEAGEGAGLRTRTARLEGSARYLRLTAIGGDGLYSVGELAVYADCPAAWPPALTRRHGTTAEDAGQWKILLFAGAMLLFLLFHRARGSRLRHLLLLPPLVCFVVMVRELVTLAPFWNLESLLRAVIAFLAAVIVLREAFEPPARAPDPRWMKGVLGLLAIGALGCYYHFGALQFWDAAKGRHTLVHPFDMRHYFPVAKYFRELRFDGLYAGSIAAYIDLHPGMTIDDVGNVKFRDLNTAEMARARDMADHIREVRARFSPERWALFRQDMKYFVDMMGRDDYLGSMRDHGGNATPVWILGASAIFARAPASELSLSLAGLIDPLLLLLLFLCVYRSFGVRVMLYVVILFGATDFYQFGSNLVGSTLRQDWLVAAGLGACALRTRRPFLGGVLLAYAGLIRAFPAMAAMFLPVPVLWALVDFVRLRRRLPHAAELREIAVQQRAPLRAVAGSAVAVVALVAVTSGLFGWQGAWGNWFKKIAIHATGPSVNNVGLRNVLMFEPSHIGRKVIREDRPEPWEAWQQYQIAAFARRQPLFVLINALFLALVLLACRRRPLEQVALLGLLTVPFIFYPSNYYCHFLFLLPMAAASRDGSDTRDRAFALGVASLLAICVAQYFSLEERGSDVRYTYQSFALLLGFLAFVLPLAREGWRTRGLLTPPGTDQAGGAPAAPSPASPASTPA